MQYQLVLQFRGDARHVLPLPDDLDETSEAATQLNAALAGTAVFDGGDAGAHGMNLFFYTADPARAFLQVRESFREAMTLSGFRVAYRTVAEEGFHPLWPEDPGATFALRP